MNADDLRERDLRDSLSPGIFEPLARVVVASAEIRPDEALLDLACGSGVLARAAAGEIDAGGRIVALDPNPERLRTAAAWLGDAAGCCLGKAEHLAFGADSFSLIVCQHGLMFFSDVDLGLREARRVLAAGGRLLATGWLPIDTNPAFLALGDALARHVGPATARPFAVPFRLAEPEALVDRFRAAGFAAAEVRRLDFELRFASTADFVGRFCRSTSLGPFVRQAGEGAVAALVDAVREKLSDYEDGDGLRSPAGAWLVVAEKGG